MLRSIYIVKKLPMNKFKFFLKQYWPLWALVLLIAKPKRFISEYIFTLCDFNLFIRSLKSYIDLVKKSSTLKDSQEQMGLLIMAGNAMNVLWLQIWVVFGGLFQMRGYKVYALTSRKNPIQNLYLRIFKFELSFIEDLKIENFQVPIDFTIKVSKLATFRDFKEFEYQNVPFGKMALSTFSRQRATGIMDIDDSRARDEIYYWIAYLYKCKVAAENLYFKNDISMIFTTEVFMEEYGSFYYAAIEKSLNIIRFAGTVRDDAIVVQHLNRDSDRTHFSSIAKNTWKEVLKYPDSATMYAELEENFSFRYGVRWALSARNQPNTKIIPPLDARKLLNVGKGEKIAVIYSHILYDTLFFNGEDIFENYADWLVQSVRAACKNDRVRWFIKIHPSNIWRGELQHFHKGKYEEVRLIEEYVGTLPAHVTVVYPDTPISPYTWLTIADFGITVRGTSGIELGALGKTVITAGSGRYEDIGFTINTNSVGDYLNILSVIPDITFQTNNQHKIAQRFAYATFCMKPFTLDFLTPIVKTGKDKIFNSDDLNYLWKFSNSECLIPPSLERFYLWSLNKDSIDFLNPWPK